MSQLAFLYKSPFKIPQPFWPNKDGKHSSYAARHLEPHTASMLGPSHQTQPCCRWTAANWPRSERRGRCSHVPGCACSAKQLKGIFTITSTCSVACSHLCNTRLQSKVVVGVWNSRYWRVFSSEPLHIWLQSPYYCTI